MANMGTIDDDAAPKFGSLTDVDPAGPFDSTDRSVTPVTSAAPSPARETQLSEDPPTTVVRADAFHELPPGTVVGDVYEIDARLGAGAMGEVYAARHIRLGKRVAIKVIGKRLSEDAAAIDRFAMEARTLAQIQHPAIVAIDHVGELTDGRAYFVMELLRGESLFNRLQRGRLPLTEALRVIDQMARGLEAAHAEGVTHRDLKPENTFLVHLPGEPPAVKLLDFGLAKLAADRSDLDRRAERTQSGVAIGTPMYMSPEQARGPNVDHRTDVYALGCIAYELLLGAAPFPHAKTAPELYAAHLHESPPLPRAIWPEIPPQLDLVLFAMLAKDPAHRPTLAQVRAVIADVRTPSPSQRAATEFVGPRKKGKGRQAAIATIVLVTLVVTLVVGITIGSAITSREALRQPTATPTPVAAPTPPPPPPQIGPVRPDGPVVQEAPIAKEIPAPPRTRSGSGSGGHAATAGSAASRPQKSVSAAIVPPTPPPTPPDAGVDAPVIETQQKTKTPPRSDRNQTLDPFHKHKGTP